MKLKGIEVGITSNVYIRIINGNTGEYKDIVGHNKATRSLLLGMYNFLRAKEGTTSYDYAPNRLRVGYGTSSPIFTDTDLQIPMYADGSLSDNYTTGSILYNTPQRGKEYLEGTNSIGLGIKFYMDSKDLEGTTADPTEINELGLYSESGILLARYKLPETIEKHENDFVDILWEITMTSIGDGEE